MKNSPFYFGFLFFLIFLGCKKNNIAITHITESSQNSFFDSAVQYLKVQLPTKDFIRLNFKKRKVLRYHGENIGVQIFENNESANKYLILRKDGNGFTGNWIDMSRLQKSNSLYHSGTVKLESVDKEILVNLEVKNNQVIQLTRTFKNSLQRKVINFRDAELKLNNYSREEGDPLLLPDIIVYWEGPDADYSSLYWLFDQYDKFTVSYFQDAGGDGGTSEASLGGGGGEDNQDNVTTAPTFTAPTEPINDIKAEVNCFLNNPSSTYSISVNVNEPSPGTRDVFAPFSNFQVGHTFLTLEQKNADGTSIIRNIGFYPKYASKPGDPLDVAIFGDDSNTPYSISLKISVSGSDFMSLINKVKMQTMVFDLNNFNCTNFAIDALKSIHINLPSTKSTSALFSGNSPGDLGEDIRNIDLNNFSETNGSRKISRIVSNSNNQSPPPRRGGC